MSTRKRITELSVAELRTQLGKRGVEVAGDRPTLIAKLKKALQNEGAKPSGSLTRTSAAAAAAAAASVSDASGAQSTDELQPVETGEEKSCSGPHDSGHSDHDTSVKDVSTKMESAPTDTETSTPDLSFVMMTPDTSVFDSSTQQASPQKEGTTPASTTADMTAVDVIASEDGQTAADQTAEKPTESPLPAGDKSADNVAPSSPGASLATSLGKTKDEKMDESVAKSNMSEDRSGNDTTSASVVSKTSSIEGTNAGADNSLWISGLTSSFRAADLKQLFGKYGRVVTAKVVTSAKSPGSKCFGFIVLATADEAQKAIKNLNNTEVQGQIITVEKDRQKRAILQPQGADKPVLATTTLWVNGLSTETKAADLKMLFIKYGKVTGAKVVTSAKNPGTKCFGLVTMSSTEEAELCIERLNKTEFHGRIISLEKAKSDVKTQTKQGTTALGKSASGMDVSAAKKDEGKDTGGNKAGAEKMAQKGKKDVPESAANANKPKAEPAKDIKKDKNILSLDKIREERERERKMQRERAEREQERQRQRQLDRERRLQQEEADRVARERERLRLEKLRLERERMKAERARMELERERHRQERELEQQRERERLERQHRESRQQVQQQTYRSDVKRAAASTDNAYWPASKRQAVETRDTSASYNYNMYSSGSGGNYYEKSGQYASGERRDTQQRRESDKGGSSAASMWPSRQSDHRSSGSAMNSYGGAADWKPMRSQTTGVTVGEWQSTGSAYRGTSSNYAQLGTDSSRQYSSSASASANHPYFGASSNQPYGKYY